MSFIRILFIQQLEFEDFLCKTVTIDSEVNKTFPDPSEFIVDE